MKRVFAYPLWVVYEIVSILALALLFLLSPLVALWLRHAARRPGARPVLLVHGYGMTRGSMLLLGWRLARAGHAPVRACGYAWWRPLDGAAAKVARAAHELAEAAGVAKVDVVAHSLGGLVSRQARANGARIARIVTLGTPHRGVFWSRLPIGPMRKALRSGAIAEVPQAGDLAITSRMDVVIPWRVATLDPPAEHLVLDGVGHGGLLLLPKAARAVVAHLEAR